MEKLVIASHNPAKINEFKKHTMRWPFKIVSLADLSITETIEETGSTFVENALIKASFYHKLTGLPVLADDGGMEIDALNGEPGVKSRRWKGYEMTDDEMIAFTLKRLHGTPWDKRTARLRLVLCLLLGANEPLYADSAIEGIITEEQRTPIIHGYPFRSILFIPKFNKMYSELSDDEHNAVNQRVSALNKLFVQL